jgi:hypothetical protein
MSDDERESTPPTGSPVPRPRPPTIVRERADAPRGIIEADAGDSKPTTLRSIFDVAEETRDAVRALKSHVMGDPEIIRISPLPSPTSLIPIAVELEPRPSLAAKAATGTGKGAKWVVFAFGVLSLIGQGIAMLGRPEYGPIVQGLKVVASALAGDATPPPGPALP